MDHVLIARNEVEPPIEFPLEDDGSLLLSTIAAQFPGVVGLKLANPEAGATRILKLSRDKLYSPEQDGWGQRKYTCIFRSRRKRKSKSREWLAEGHEPANEQQHHSPSTDDLIVLGLSWNTTDRSMKEYFEENIGPVEMVEVKKTFEGKSRGFGFVRFRNVAKQRKALKCRHKIDDKWCDVSYSPNSKIGPTRVYVGQLTPDITVTDLKQFFQKEGKVTDVFIPRPFRGYGFVTFLSPQVAKDVCEREDFVIKGVSVYAISTKDQQGGSARVGSQYSNNARESDNGSQYDDWDDNAWMAGFARLAALLGRGLGNNQLSQLNSYSGSLSSDNQQNRYDSYSVGGTRGNQRNQYTCYSRDGTSDKQRDQYDSYSGGGTQGNQRNQYTSYSGGGSKGNLRNQYTSYSRDGTSDNQRDQYASYSRDGTSDNQQDRYDSYSGGGLRSNRRNQYTSHSKDGTSDNQRVQYDSYSRDGSSVNQGDRSAFKSGDSLSGNQRDQYSSYSGSDLNNKQRDRYTSFTAGGLEYNRYGQGFGIRPERPENKYGFNEDIPTESDFRFNYSHPTNNMY